MTGKTVAFEWLTSRPEYGVDRVGANYRFRGPGFALQVADSSEPVSKPTIWPPLFVPNPQRRGLSIVFIFLEILLYRWQFELSRRKNGRTLS